MFKKFVAKIFILIIFSSFNQIFSITQDAYQLFFSYKYGILTYEGCTNVRVPRKRIERNDGDWRVLIFNTKGNIAFQMNISDQRIINYDEMLPDGSFTGFRELKNEARFSIYIPIIDKIESIEIFKDITEKQYSHENLSEEINLRKIGGCKLNLSKVYTIQDSNEIPKIINVEKLIDNGPDDRRIVVVFFPKAFSESELEIYRSNVNDLLYAGRPGQYPYDDDFLGIFHSFPLKEFYNCFNFYRVDVTDFSYDFSKSWFDDYLKDYLPFGADIYCFLDRTKWGGLGWSWGMSIGRKKDVGGYETPSNGLGNLFLHELGHTDVGGFLGDEYVYVELDNCSEPPPLYDSGAPNITIFTEKNMIKWKHWISDITPLPTKNPYSVGTYEYYRYPVIGAFEGATWKCYYYRPKFRCKMYGSVNFCGVCREFITIDLLTDWIDVFKFASSNIQDIIYRGQIPSLNFSVSLDQVLLSNINNPQIIWYLDGQPLFVFNDKTNIDIDVLSFLPGKHQIKVAVIGKFKGTEEFIRKDVDTNFYYSFPKFEVTKGSHKRKK